MILMEKKELVNTINDLALQLERQDAQMRELNRVVADLGMTVDGSNGIVLKIRRHECR